jgi:NAD(P) transhydrogenase
MKDEMRKYDLIVLGSGPSGLTGARTACPVGRSVALVESRHELGGAGINTVTVPSKTLRKTALALSGARSRNLYGMDLSLRREATVADFLRHEHDVKAGFNAAFSQHIEDHKIDVYHGSGALVDRHTFRVSPRSARRDGRQRAAGPGILLDGQNVLIATGSTPVHPPIFPFGPGVYDSDTILQLDRLPRTMAVIGAGVIGSEYACTFGALGKSISSMAGMLSGPSSTPRSREHLPP